MDYERECKFCDARCSNCTLRKRKQAAYDERTIKKLYLKDGYDVHLLLAHLL